ncbi:hypothetical protein [Pseudobutyrivibrio sp. LB2011]|uniref:hypothetical protein n=1 Tax=Pseudobutyrivibrio sp. LB2011 TaxID=1408312 RepID=UPI0005D295D0|nr:hypothetical protein [Pseudobutyrivibrio sp. LB2011]
MTEYLAENNYLFQSSISSSYLYFSNFANKDTSFENALKTTSDEQLNTQELTDGGKNKGNSYTRIVSATVMNSELRTTTGEGGITAYSYQNFKPHINKLMETLMGVTMEKFNVSLDTVVEEPAELQTKDLGFGFVLSPGSAFGMTATQIINPDSDDVIVRVKMSEASGGETFDVNISEVDPRNATAIEMFAYCQYADSIGKGIAKSNFPSWNTVNRYMDPSGVFEFDSVEQAATKKFNWVEAISESDIYYKRESTGEILGSKDILEMLMESYKKIHEKDDEDGDWRKMTDEEWEKLLARVDADIDDMVERVKEETEAAKEERAKAELEKEAELL